MNKRVFSFVLAVLMMFSLLSGCMKEESPAAPQVSYEEEKLPSLTLDKEVYKKGEAIIATCQDGDEGDVLFLYQEAGTRGDNEPIQEKRLADGDLSFDSQRLLPGNYVVYLCDDDRVYIHDAVYFRVYNPEDVTDYTIQSAEVRLNEQNRICVDIQPAEEILIRTEYRFYWGKDGVCLEDYTPVATYVKVDSEPFTVELNQGLYMPQEANGLVIRVLRGPENSFFVELHQELQPTESKILYQYNVLSDLHVSPSWPRCNALVTKAFKDIIAQGNSAVIFTVGDNTERGEPAEYDLLNQLVADAGEKLPDIYYAMGNHDIVYNNDAGFDNQLALYMEKTGMSGAYYAAPKDGYLHIVLGSDTLSHLGTMGQEQQDWLKAQLEAADPNQPVFIYMHQPLRDTTSGTLYTKYEKSDTQDSFGFLEDGNAIREILKDYPNAIVLTGHTHLTFMDEQPVLLGGGEDANFVACSSVGKAEGLSMAEGLYIEIYEDYILIRGRDFGQSKWVGAMQIMIPVYK